ncbi:hypothetical protein DFH06DRAFT_1168512 [Mycena polygramma]|nr:hypothetical protein DFH06DRAFT_1168512 [Mycena polygramma]
MHFTTLFIVFLRASLAVALTLPEAAEALEPRQCRVAGDFCSMTREGMCCSGLCCCTWTPEDPNEPGNGCGYYSCTREQFSGLAPGICSDLRPGV